MKTIKCERESRCIYADEENDHFDYVLGFRIKISDGTDIYCDDYEMSRESSEEDIQVRCFVYNKDGVGYVVEDFSFTDEDVFEDYSKFKIVEDVCNHEDYPCCGCSLESYPMCTERAIPLCKEGRVRILGDYVPDPIF